MDASYVGNCTRYRDGVQQRKIGELYDRALRLRDERDNLKVSLKHYATAVKESIKDDRIQLVLNTSSRLSNAAEN